MQEVAGKRLRFGYRRIGVLLERKDMSMSHKNEDRDSEGAVYRLLPMLFVAPVTAADDLSEHETGVNAV